MYLPLDLETTGLDPRYGSILEVAWTLADGLFYPSRPFRSYLVEPSLATWEYLENAEQVVKNMHEASGLLDDLQMLASGIPTPGQPFGSIQEIETHILADIARLVPAGDDVILLGQSPQGVDRPFIHRFMPRLDAKLSYRHFDVRTLMDFFSSVGVNPPDNPEDMHRAKADAEWSLATARSYRGFTRLP